MKQAKCLISRRIIASISTHSICHMEYDWYKFNIRQQCLIQNLRLVKLKTKTQPPNLSALRVCLWHLSNWHIHTALICVTNLRENMWRVSIRALSVCHSQEHLTVLVCSSHTKAGSCLPSGLLSFSGRFYAVASLSTLWPSTSRILQFGSLGFGAVGAEQFFYFGNECLLISNPEQLVVVAFQDAARPSTSLLPGKQFSAGQYQRHQIAAPCCI